MRPASPLLLCLMTAAFVVPVVPCPARGDEVRRFEMRLENGRQTHGPPAIVVKRGDRVEINWRVDRPTVLHLHGYDIEVSPGPDKPQTMGFTARATGRFPIETHAPAGDRKAGHHRVLIYLEVHPR